MSEEAHADHAKHYVRIWFILVVMLIISVCGPEIGTLTGVKAITLFTAFGIAVYKAYLVIKNFMHINLEPKFVTYFVTTALVFMFLFFAGAAPDVMKATGQGWNKPAWVEAQLAAASGHADASHGAEAAGHH